MDRDCEHGQLARSCNICDLERELKAVTAQRDKLLKALEIALNTLDDVQDNINPERGYADELEADVMVATGGSHRSNRRSERPTVKLLFVALLAFSIGSLFGNHGGDQATLRDCATKGRAAMVGGGTIKCEVLTEVQS